jgi:hypothetical protein
MIETISPWPSVRLRHESAPLLKEREQDLTHLLQQGYSRVSVRNTAAYLVHVVRVMNVNSMRIVPPREIEAAGQSWAAYEGPLRKKVSPRGSPRGQPLSLQLGEDHLSSSESYLCRGNGFSTRGVSAGNASGCLFAGLADLTSVICRFSPFNGCGSPEA